MVVNVVVNVLAGDVVGGVVDGVITGVISIWPLRLWGSIGCFEVPATNRNSA